MKKWLAVWMLALAVCVLSPGSVLAKDNVASGEARRTISVSGVAEAVLDAEYAKVSLTVSNVKPKMSESHDAVIKIIKNLYAELKKAGIKENDIDKSLMKQGKAYKYVNGSAIANGYESSVSMIVTVGDISKLGAVYEVLAAYDSVTVGYTEFERSDEFEQRRELFKKALLAAKTKAEFMAKTLGAEVGEVVSIEEEALAENYFVGSGYSNSIMRGDTNDTGSYGSVTIKARVSVVFELK